MASMRQNSWFSGSRLSIEKVLALTYTWAHKFTTTQAVHETSLDDESTSTETVIDWYNYCREVCADRIMNHHAGQIGGPGMTVEIDESKFGKTKYNRGRYIEGQWVFGGICRQTKACFLVPVAQRDKDTLLPIIRTHILPGTHVMSDMWKAYDCLKDEGYSHLTVNHSLNFVDPDTGAHTQRIENTWWGVKRSTVCLEQEHPKISSKAIYKNGCGASTMEMILLETFSSTSPICMMYTKMRKWFFVPLYALVVILLPIASL